MAGPPALTADVADHPPAPAAGRPRLLQAEPRPGVLDLGLGHPHPSLLPVAAWQDAAHEAARTYGWQALTYGWSAGPRPLLDWLAAHLSSLDGARCTAAELFVTAGASHAISLVAQVLAEPGDVAVVDSPTYHYALRILRDRGVGLVRAPADEHGPDPDGVGRVLAHLARRGRRVPLLYLVPTFGNPTGRSVPATRRRDLLRVARDAGVTVVEDDTYRELAYDAPAPESLWGVSGGRGVVRVGSFSKTVAPGLRLGWVNAPAAVVDRLCDIAFVDSGGGVNHATAVTMATFCASGAYAGHVRSVRAAYAGRRDALVGALRAAAPGLDVPSPAGGWFVWVPLPGGVTARTLLPVAERHGVSFAPGTEFYPGGTDGDDHVRLSFSLLEPAELAVAAGRLAASLRR